LQVSFPDPKQQANGRAATREFLAAMEIAPKSIRRLMPRLFEQMILSLLLLLLKPHRKTEMFCGLLAVPNLWATYEKSQDLFLLRIEK
jgi:hypothetical protein